MKLIYCQKCQDVFKLDIEERSCKCGICMGKYLDELNAEYSGEFAIPVGFDNHSLVAALQVYETTNRKISNRFEAFLISEPCSTFIKRK